LSQQLPPDDSQRWMTHVQGLVQCALTITDSGFKRERTADRSSKIMGKVFQITTSNIDQVIQQISQISFEDGSNIEPKCSAGCDYCCYHWVRATALEVFAVYQHIRDTYTADQISNLHDALRRYREEFFSHPQGTHFALGCPLLVDHRCSVYESRPLICRGTTSLDVEACKVGKDRPGDPNVFVPVITPLLSVAAALRQGMATGLRQLGMGGSDLALGLALLVLFDDPSAVDKYFAGENVFASATAL
jgi:Fe-S-cluster containining protein